MTTPSKETAVKIKKTAVCEVGVGLNNFFTVRQAIGVIEKGNTGV
jgi:hypothetical protein